MKYKKIFITGIGGFVGSNLAEELIQMGYNVEGCDNFIGGCEENIPAKATHTTMDCRCFDAMVGLLQDSEVVFHCASSPYEGLSVFSPSIVAKNTFDSTVTTLSASICAGVKKFIFLSSMARYGDQRYPFNENMIPSPVDPYGISKVASEQMVEMLCKQHGIDYTIVVPHNIIGPKQKYNDPYRNVASIMINRMMQGKQPIIYGDGKQKRSFSYITDCVKSMARILEVEETNGEIINIGPDDMFITINALAKLIGDLLKFKVDPIYYSPQPLEVKNAMCSSDKAKRILKYSCEVPVMMMIMHMINWIKRCGVKEFDYNLPIEIKKDCPKTWTDKLM